MRPEPERAYFAQMHGDGELCAVHGELSWGKKQDLTPITRAEAEKISAARRARAPKPAISIPIGSGADEATVQRLEAAAATVNAAAGNTASIETIKTDLRELTINVQELAGIVSVLRQAEAIEPLGLSGPDIRALSDQIAAYGLMHEQTGRRLAALEEGQAGLINRLDDLYVWHDRLAGQVNTMVSYRPDRRVQPPADLPPLPPTGHQSGWVKDVLDGMSDDDPLLERPQEPQEGQGNETASDHVQDMNVVREPRTAAESAKQHISIEETRHMTVEDRWAKPFARYQIAVQAKNGSLGAKRSLTAAAERHGLTIEDLADKLIGEWKQIELDLMADY